MDSESRMSFVSLQMCSCPHLPSRLIFTPTITTTRGRNSPTQELSILPRSNSFILSLKCRKSLMDSRYLSHIVKISYILRKSTSLALQNHLLRFAKINHPLQNLSPVAKSIDRMVQNISTACCKNLFIVWVKNLSRVLQK